MNCVNSIHVSPCNITLEAGTWYYDVSVEVSPSDADCTAVTWHSDNPSVASVNASSGYIYAGSVGTARVYATATDGSGCSDYITVTVCGSVPVESIALNHSTVSVETGNSITLAATVTPANASNPLIDWSSSNHSVATVNDGVVTAVSQGTAIITATACDGSEVSASCTVNVTSEALVSCINVMPASVTLHIGESIFLEAEICSDDAANQSVTWHSSNPNIATVNASSGLVMAQSLGTTTIYATAQDGSGVSGSCTVCVVPVDVESIVVSPDTITMNVGDQTNLEATVSPANATNKAIVWSSNDTGIAEVDANGEVTAKAAGTTYIYATAQDGSGVQGSCQVTVNPATKYYHIVNKASGKVVNIYGTDITFLTANQNVTLYESTESNEQIWRIDEFSDQVQCFVKSYVDETFGLNVNKRLSNYLNCDVTRLSGNETDSAVYFISHGNGDYYIQLANAIEDHCYFLTAKGTTNGSDIRWETAQESDLQLWRFESVGVIAPIPAERIQVSPETLAMNVGETQSLSAEVFPANATNTMIRWTSENSTIAEVDSVTGYVTAKAAGTTDIYATAQDGSGVQGSCQVTVNANGTHYYIINKSTKDLVTINGEIKDHASVVCNKRKNSDLQIWGIDNISADNDCYIKSYLDEDYGFNVNRKQSDFFNCDVLKISGNERDAAVRFLYQEDEVGYYKIQLANYPNYYLTLMPDEIDVRWDNTNQGEYQLWKLDIVDWEQYNAEHVEYHLLCNGDTNKALRVGTKNVLSIDTDLPVRGERRSYWNRQKWTIKGTGNKKQLCSQLDNEYYLCNDGFGSAYISKSASDTNSYLTITPYGNGDDMYEIKITQSGLYLTFEYNNADDLYWGKWRAYDANIHETHQVWKLVMQPIDYHLGVDSYSPVSATTAKVLAKNNKEFAIRYYTSSTTSGKLLKSDEVTNLHNAGLKIVSAYQDDGQSIDEFYETEAIKDAQKALELATAVGQPRGSVIYFAVDYAPKDSEKVIIKNYFTTIKSQIGDKYEIGVYGTAEICNLIKSDGIKYSWLGQSTGAYSKVGLGAEGSAGYISYDSQQKYDIKQAEKIIYNNTLFDNDTAIVENYGQW